MDGLRPNGLRISRAAMYRSGKLSSRFQLSKKPRSRSTRSGVGWMRVFGGGLSTLSTYGFHYQNRFFRSQALLDNNQQPPSTCSHAESLLLGLTGVRITTDGPICECSDADGIGREHDLGGEWHNTIRKPQTLQRCTGTSGVFDARHQLIIRILIVNAANTKIATANGSQVAAAVIGSR
jgi:hypothetical protein